MLFQNTLWLSALVGLFIMFSWTGLLLSVILGWLYWVIGVSAGLHKMSAHRAFEPKNKFCKWLLLFFATLTGFGNTLVWTAVHRVHHPKADTPEDPHSPKYFSYWRLLLLLVDGRHLYDAKLIKDIIDDKDHKWFAKYYYHIHIALAVTLFAMSPWVLVYCYLVPLLYLTVGMSWITVGSHSNNLITRTIGYRNFDQENVYYNSKLMSVLLPGDGNHDNHHKYPGAAKNSSIPGDWETGFWLIKLVGKNINVTGHSK